MPVATYRVQLHPGFGFADAAAVADYLAALGVSHLYASPYLEAIPGSMHGYDVVDHRHARDDLGGDEAHAAMCARLQEVGLGQLLDIVPNHMAVHRTNAWWWDVLENGPASRYARYFDVDWDPPESTLRNLVLVPVLADHYGRMLDAGAITLRRDGTDFVVAYESETYPVAPRSLDEILSPAAAAVRNDELAFLSDAFGALPRATTTDPERARRRHRDKEVLRAQLARLLRDDADVAAAVDEQVRLVNGDVDRLHALLERQNYRLARWQYATHALDYRRFFDVTGLVGLHMEDARVFHDAHVAVVDWVRRGLVDGLRVDHIDGLRDPEQYLERLLNATGRAWIVVEKILEHGERLPDWPIDGTTGYEFAALTGRLLVDARNEEVFTQRYASFTGCDAPFGVVARDAKRQVLDQVLAADVARLTNHFVAVCEAERRHRDYSRQELALALTEVLVAFPVYRTYARRRADGTAELSDADRAVIDHTLAVVESEGLVDPELLALLGRVLRLEIDQPPAIALCVEFQQFSGPVMAKGVEDTALYRYNRLVALNEVGGDPHRFGASAHEFHAAAEHTLARWPRMLLATSTHDTKRSEDVRARLAVLSEIPDDWFAAVERWSTMNERHRQADVLDRNMEYLLYQTFVGAHPLPVDRALEYAEKAAREAKAHTSWLAPDPVYEDAMRSFIEGVLADREFLDDLDAFVARIADAGRANSLAQVLLKLTAPGVGDVYQGEELWDLSLVDPDNRRPVDFDLRRKLLGELAGLDVAGVVARADDGLPKLWVTQRALTVRRHLPEAFGPMPAGGYQPLTARGPHAEHVIAFCRGGAAVTVVSRFATSREGGWRDTAVELPDGRWHDVLSGTVHQGPEASLSDVLARLPVALLVRAVS